MIKVVVKRSRWIRGDSDNARLRTQSGKQCCIGFLAKTLGAKNKDILDIARLDDLDYKPCDDFDEKHRDALDSAYETNDLDSIDDKVREKELRLIGRKMGVRFQFVD